VQNLKKAELDRYKELESLSKKVLKDDEEKLDKEISDLMIHKLENLDNMEEKRI